jgi:hypothetical protein
MSVIGSPRAAPRISPAPLAASRRKGESRPSGRTPAISGTGLDHPLVVEYLDDIDKELAGRLTEQAARLREHISAQLTESLPPDADDAAVAAALKLLGTPAELAAEATGAVQAGGLKARRRLSVRAWFTSLGWRRQTVLAVAAAVVIAAVAYEVVVQTAAPLVLEGSAGWWFRADWSRAVETTADGASQTTVPIRSGQRQGYFVDLYNPSNLTQTILGPATGPGVPADSIGSPTQAADVGVSAPNRIIDEGGASFGGVKFVIPGVIPPHQLRAVRVLWTSTVCDEGTGSATGNDRLALRVRIGWIVRIEVIPLGEGWFVAGPSQGHYCPQPATQPGAP